LFLIPHLQNSGAERTELRELCGHLHEAYRKSKKEALEWKSLIVLDKKQEGSLSLEPERTLTPPETAAAVAYADIMGEVGSSNSSKPLLSPPPHFSSGRVRIGRSDGLAIERGAYSELSKERSLVKMKERLEAVEGEKAELIKVSSGSDGAKLR